MATASRQQLETSNPLAVVPNRKKFVRLTLWPLVAATFFMVSGGTYGTEDIVHGAGYGRAILILLITPLLWSLPTAFMIGELSSALPHEGGYYAWVRRAMGNFWGFQEAWLSLVASIFDMAIYPTLFVAYLTRMFPWFQENNRGWWVALAVVVACALLNIAGVLIDDLTGLYNRKGFLALAEHRMTAAVRDEEAFSVAFIDLDGLKEINDSLGHETGNAALIEVAKVLEESFRQSDILGRLGGDEFAVFILHADEDEIGGIGRRIQHHLDTHNAAPNRRYRLSFSIGIVSHGTAKSGNIEGLLRAADALMYEQKRAKTLSRREMGGAHA